MSMLCITSCFRFFLHDCIMSSFLLLFDFFSTSFICMLWNIQITWVLEWEILWNYLRTRASYHIPLQRTYWRRGTFVIIKENYTTTDSGSNPRGVLTKTKTWTHEFTYVSIWVLADYPVPSIVGQTRVCCNLSSFPRHFRLS